MMNEKRKQKLKQHLVDATGLVALSTPVFSVLETQVAGISSEASKDSRLFGAGLLYAGWASVYSKGRDLSRSIFGITDESKERYQEMHDALYGTAFSLTTSPPFYYLAGVRDWKEIAWATGISTAYGLCAGIPSGYIIDVFRDLAGIEDSHRTPLLLKKQKSSVKKAVIAAVLGASLAATAGIYALTPNTPAEDKTERIEHTTVDRK